MKRFVKLATTLALAGAVAPTVARAQDSTERTMFLKAPVFVLQPGGVTSNAISADTLNSTTSFNARFATVVPTAFPYFSLVFGAQVQTGGHATRPNIFYGGIIPIPYVSQVTGGFVDISFDPLGVTDFGGTTTRAGGTFFVAEGAVVFQVGKMMMAGLGPAWSGIGVYFLLDQSISGPLPRDKNGDTDRWRPVLLYGLNIPLGWGK